MATSNWFMVVLTLVYVIATICIMFWSVLQFKETFRPRVYFDFKFEGHDMYIVIKNFGKKAAYNIVIKFIPDIEYQMGGKKTLNDQPFIKNLTFLSPQNEIDSMIGLSHEVLPMQNSKAVNAVINYTDEKGIKYNESYFFSWDAYSKRAFILKKGIHEIAVILEQMKDLLRK